VLVVLKLVLALVILFRKQRSAGRNAKQ
jgi:hypothetical protein